MIKTDVLVNTTPRLLKSTGRAGQLCCPVEAGGGPVVVGLRAPVVSEGSPTTQVRRTGKQGSSSVGGLSPRKGGDWYSGHPGPASLDLVPERECV